MARQLGNVRSVASWTRSLGGIALARRDYAQARLLLRGEPRHPPHARRPVGDLPLALEPCARGCRSTTTTTRRGACSRRASRSSGRRATGRGWRLQPRGVRGARRGARIARARAARLYACASVLRESVGSPAVEVGWPDPRPLRRPPPFRARRGGIRRGVGAGTGDDAGRVARLRARGGGRAGARIGAVMYVRPRDRGTDDARPPLGMRTLPPPTRSSAPRSAGRCPSGSTSASRSPTGSRPATRRSSSRTGARSPGSSASAS